ncbi:hypothetical protein KY332_04475 [Candidatus Woesearchaeota archaeon]|nr:hypothetical protein [Candidatus Woesearchaeota archaeon]
MAEDLLEIRLSGEKGQTKKIKNSLNKWLRGLCYEDFSIQANLKEKKLTLKGDAQSNFVPQVLKQVQKNTLERDSSAEFKSLYTPPKKSKTSSSQESTGLKKRIGQLEKAQAESYQRIIELEEENKVYISTIESLNQKTGKIGGELEAVKQDKDATETEYLELLDKQSKLEADIEKVSGLIGIKEKADSLAIDDLFVLLMKEVYVPAIEKISVSYEDFLANLGINPEEVDSAIKLVRKPLEETGEYKQIKKISAEAEKEKKFAEEMRQKKFKHVKVDIDLSDLDEILNKEKELKASYENAQKMLNVIRSSLGREQKIPYLMTVNDAGKTINLVLPISAEKKELGPIEDDMIKHIRKVLGEYRNQGLGKYKKVERNGLVQYTFNASAKSKKDFKYQIQKELCTSQVDYLLYKIGVRTDITLEENTLDIALSKVIVKSVRKIHQPDLLFGQEDVDAQYYATAKTSREYGVLLPNPGEFIERPRKDSLRNYAALMTAFSNGNLTVKEADNLTRKILEKRGIKPSKTLNVRAMLKNLTECGILEESKTKTFNRKTLDYFPKTKYLCEKFRPLSSLVGYDAISMLVDYGNNEK